MFLYFHKYLYYNHNNNNSIISKIINYITINLLKYVSIIKKIIKLNKQILNVYQDLK